MIAIIESFALLDSGLDVLTKLLAERALVIVAWQVGINCCRLGDILFV